MTEVTERKHTSSNHYVPDIVLGDFHILVLLTLQPEDSYYFLYYISGKKIKLMKGFVQGHKSKK